LLQENNTRWNSCFHMLKRIVLLSDNINDTLQILKKDEHILSNEDLKLVDHVISLLQPFEEITNNLSGESYITSSLVLPAIDNCITSVEKKSFVGNSKMQNFQNHLSECLKERFQHLFEDEDFILATFLDQKFKGLKMIKEEQTKETFFLKLKQKMKSIHVDDSPIKRKKEKFSSLFAEYHEETIEETLEETEEELQSYINYKLTETELNMNPLVFWKHENRWKRLQSLTQKVFTICATSTSSERGFSGMGLICTKLRSSLHPETAGGLLFLKKNTDLW
jgi:zinc finger BED domain-containing protein 1 (E3 SUMO-protein ligase ZBED1)